MRLIMLGMTLEESARAVGVHPETILNWRKKGAAQTNGEYKDFFEGVEKAFEACKVNALGAIEKAMRGEKGTRTITRTFKDGTEETRSEEYWVLPPQWTAAAWRMERLAPERWGRQVPLIQQNIQQNSVTQHVQQLQTMSGEELEARKRELLEGERKLIEGHVVKSEETE